MPFNSPVIAKSTMNPQQCSRRDMYLLLAVPGFLAACATPSSGTHEVQTPFRLGASAPKIAVKIAAPSNGMDPLLLNELIGATVAALRETRRFARVVSTGASAEGSVDLLLEINVVAAREVTTALRGFAGAFAGTGSLIADVRVLDVATANVVGKAVISANTSGGSILAGTNSQAVDRFAEQIVQFVLGR